MALEALKGFPFTEGIPLKRLKTFHHKCSTAIIVRHTPDNDAHRYSLVHLCTRTAPLGDHPLNGGLEEIEPGSGEFTLTYSSILPINFRIGRHRGTRKILTASMSAWASGYEVGYDAARHTATCASVTHRKGRCRAVFASVRVEQRDLM